MNISIRQQGAVLVVSLLLLLLLTVIAITAANVSTLQLRMASNSQQQNIAFQAAESGLRLGQEWVDGGAETHTLTISGEHGNGTIPAYSVETTVRPLSGYSLNADLGGNDRASGIFQAHIVSHGKACDDDSCQPDANSDNLPSAEHRLGCIMQIVTAPLCE